MRRVWQSCARTCDDDDVRRRRRALWRVQASWSPLSCTRRPMRVDGGLHGRWMEAGGRADINRIYLREWHAKSPTKVRCRLEAAPLPARRVCAPAAAAVGYGAQVWPRTTRVGHVAHGNVGAVEAWKWNAHGTAVFACCTRPQLGCVAQLLLVFVGAWRYVIHARLLPWVQPKTRQVM